MNPTIPTYSNAPLPQQPTFTRPPMPVAPPSQNSWMDHFNAIMSHLHSLGVPFVQNVQAAMNHPDPNVRQQQLQNINKQMNAYKTTQQQLNQAMNMK